MKKFLSSAVVSVCLLLFAAPALSKDIYSHVVLNLPFDLRTNGQWVKVIDNPKDWADFYESLRPALADYVPGYFSAPEIDFNNFVIVAGGLGYRNSGGDRLSIESVIDAGDRVYVSALAVSAGAGCAVTMAVTYPTVAIMIRKADKPISVFLGKAVSDCK
ncbi:MAG: protease complex subunit PrcB family protein [Pseudomonadota bacterium]